MENNGKYITGRVDDYVQRKGWFFGHFMQQELLHSDLVEVSWQKISNKKAVPEDKHTHKKSVEINIVISGTVHLVINVDVVNAKKEIFG